MTRRHLGCLLSALVVVLADTQQTSPLESERQNVAVVEIFDHFEKIDVDLAQSGKGSKMTAVDGTEYVCFRPKEKETVEDEKKLADAKRESSDSDIIKKQLSTLNGSCFLKRTGYWSYKFCPFNKVEQIHFEGSNEQVKFELGFFQSEQQEPEFDSADSKSDRLTQSFVGGTNGRESTVVFTCRPEVEGVEFLGIQEKEMHKYQIEVATHLACHTSPEWQARQLLAGLRGQCFRRVESWWTYELCFERLLRQYHKEQDGRLTEFSLGEFDSTENNRLETSKQVLTRDRHTGRAVLQQKYTGGTKCDLKEVHRSATVQFMCNVHAHAYDQAQLNQVEPTTIVGISESPSCNYIVKVHTPLLCNHPFFKDGMHSKKEKKLSKIQCVPEHTYTTSERSPQ